MGLFRTCSAICGTNDTVVKRNIAETNISFVKTLIMLFLLFIFFSLIFYLFLGM